MRWILSILLLIAFSATAGVDGPTTGKNRSLGSSTFNAPGFAEQLGKIILERKPARINLGFSKGGRFVEAFFFPGSSDKKALVIGGVHGSELSSVEVSRNLIRQLENENASYYNVIIVPCLFPDNMATALKYYEEIGSEKNIGRYTHNKAADPNRQMPSPGTFNNNLMFCDHAGREIEGENILLLQLINEFRPQRIASVHAIRNTNCAGFFADPRTNAQGIALGYETDSSLAISMARHVFENGGNVAGNHLREGPRSLYYNDPVAQPRGKFQPRKTLGTFLPGERGWGISLGTWGATAVKDISEPTADRDAMRVITIEFPGSKRPGDYLSSIQQIQCDRTVSQYASAIRTIFLQEYFVENSTNGSD